MPTTPFSQASFQVAFKNDVKGFRHAIAQTNLSKLSLIKVSIGFNFRVTAMLSAVFNLGVFTSDKFYVVNVW